MKREKTESGIPYLPEEIITNILKRLPVKSLIRFRSVCDLWKNIISAPSFITDHLNYSNHQIPSLISTYDGALIKYSLDLNKGLREVQVGPPIDSIRPHRILGSCNGLVCLQTGGRLDPLSMWNPALREVMRVPRSRTLRVHYLGFGFNPFVNDYKIIVMTYASWRDMVNNVVSGVEVYSLATNSWKDIEFSCLDGIRGFSQSLNVNGSIFWLARKTGLDQSLVIVSFDLALEDFILIPTPALSGEGEAKLTVYENRPALFYSSFSTNSSNSALDLWVIEEGIGTFWSKKCTFGPYPFSIHPWTIWFSIHPWTICRNHIVCSGVSYFSTVQLEEGDDYSDVKVDTFLINLASNEYKVLYESTYGYSGHSFEYVESLLSLRNIQLGNP
ncbi:unnamed protein product [Cuscuta europaea]|uniref:F-box domain-containing protein n=1 Tax=Cuscuta europaea TaxID=41803 RepID=A0A9P1E0I2_CUSEU|nr:unnamed protein product [Cuscuta europaea]